jgi:diaminopimelate decarboxylase
VTNTVVAGVRQYFALAASEFHVGSVPVSELAGRYGTPLFLYDRAVADTKLALLQKTLPPRFEIYYSVKANPNPAIVGHFVSRGCGLEIASSGELTVAREVGCSAERIVFAGPGKTDLELEAGVRSGIGEVHVESVNEIHRLAAVCKRLNSRARVSLRVNPTGDSQGGAMRMGGKPAPFGIDEEKLEGVLPILAAQADLDFRGIHMYAGTQILDYSVLAHQYRRCLEIARRVASQIDRPLHTVDFGGGLGVPYFENENELDMTALRRELSAISDEISRDPVFERTRFLVEPGRYLVSEAGVYVTRVIDIKESRGKKYVIADGGMHHHLAASGNLGQTIKRNYPIAILNKLNHSPAEAVDVVGPLCTPLDTIGRAVHLPTVEIGDLVGIFQSGAYARTASPLGFLSHPTPPEVLVDGGDHHLIRARGQIDALRDVVARSGMEVRG